MKKEISRTKINLNFGLSYLPDVLFFLSKNSCNLECGFLHDDLFFSFWRTLACYVLGPRPRAILSLASRAGVPKQGEMGGYIPPIIWLYPPNTLRMVHTGIPPNNLNGCTSEGVNLGEKCSVLVEDLFFIWSSPEFGEKSVPFAYFFFGIH